MEKYAISEKHKELGKTLVNFIVKREHNGDIIESDKIHMKEVPFLFGYDSSISISEGGAFISKPGENIEKLFPQIKEEFPYAFFENSMIMCYPKNGETFDQKKFLNLLGITPNEKYDEDLANERKIKDKEYKLPEFAREYLMKHGCTEKKIKFFETYNPEYLKKIVQSGIFTFEDAEKMDEMMKELKQISFYDPITYQTKKFSSIEDEIYVKAYQNAANNKIVDQEILQSIAQKLYDNNDNENVLDRMEKRLLSFATVKNKVRNIEETITHSTEEKEQYYSLESKKKRLEAIRKELERRRAS